MNPVVDSPAGLTPAWLTAALGTEVRSARAEKIGTGQTSSTYRLTIDTPAAPPTVIAKLAEGDLEARLQVRTAHRTEVGFYRKLGPKFGPAIPLCLHKAVTEDGSGFTLLLEDLAPRRPGRQVDGCSIGQASTVVETLAEIHAATWNDPALGDLDFIVAPSEDRARFLADLTRTAAGLFVDRYQSSLSSEISRTLRDSADALFAWLVATTAPFALIHGDFRLDNLIFAEDERRPVVVDWQTASIGLPARDLGYFIGTALTEEDRGEAEHHLVGRYHQTLSAAGVADYTLGQCTADYRTGLLQGPMITVLGSMTSVGPRDIAGDEMFLSMANRSCAAIRDNDSLSLI